jgi:hypothetical protein
MDIYILDALTYPYSANTPSLAQVTSFNLEPIISLLN